jgi:hypothetical protein
MSDCPDCKGYDVGYFEGFRNALLGYIRMPDKEQWLEWMETEIEEARRLRDDE